MRRDLRDALDERDFEAARASNRSDDAAKNCVRHACSWCSSFPAPGGKLRYCGGCHSKSYCCNECAHADWAVHKPACASLRATHDEALAAHEAEGGRKQDFNQATRDILNRFAQVPGLINELNLLAWEHRSKTPLICVSICQSDINSASSSGLRIQMVPRSLWDKDLCFFHSEAHREDLRRKFSSASFCRNTKYMCAFSYEDQGTISTTYTFLGNIIRGAEIVGALALATKAEDLADAFAWYKTTFPTHEAQQFLQTLRERLMLVHDSNTSQSFVPIVTRATNNEVACMMMDSMSLENDICLTGLHNATHLNGRKGIILGQDPVSFERWKALLDGGMVVSVKAINFVHSRRGDYRRISR